ncbi:microtubule-associated protein Jupiter [Caerostris extrusa]|uniref:Microtubule-associated protein Jupiter n=1 Tax=Caerostris extrusa TaxID=172846 RepID=A0AAV4NGP8_CAEEX|nr:microtubule-associated protein Jupiter [Caerostris extrusa]
MGKSFPFNPKEGRITSKSHTLRPFTSLLRVSKRLSAKSSREAPVIRRALRNQMLEEEFGPKRKWHQNNPQRAVVPRRDFSKEPFHFSFGENRIQVSCIRLVDRETPWRRVQRHLQPQERLRPANPRKTKNYMQSSIFSPDSPYNGHTTPSPKSLDTQNRLFGADAADGSTPRRVVNRQRSSIFEDEVVDSRPHSQKTTPARRPCMNPITGEPFMENGGSPNGSFSNGGSPNGSINGGTPMNGRSNGGTPTNGHSNGYTNGHSTPESPMNGDVKRYRNPPGGKSSGIF